MLRAIPRAVERLERRELLKLLHRTYNEMLAVSGNARSVIGVYPEEDYVAFKLYPGRFERELLKNMKVSFYASLSTEEYADFALFKELKLSRTPLGKGPQNWYLAFDCSLVYYINGMPSEVGCVPLRAFYRPAPPPKRSFCLLIEVLVRATRIHLGEDINKILTLLKEVERLGDEEDKRVTSKIRNYLLLSPSRRDACSRRGACDALP